MAISYSDIEQTRIHLANQVRLVDNAIQDASYLIQGRLRSSDVPDYTLKALKKELRNFNTRTGKWKD